MVGGAGVGIVNGGGALEAFKENQHAVQGS